MIVLGLTGRIASGKEEVAEYFIKKDFIYFSLSEEVRGEARERNIEITRSNLQDLGDMLREEEGLGVLVKRVKKKFREEYDFLVGGIRNTGEVEELRKFEGVKLISIDAPVKERYKRILSRKDQGDDKTYQGFLKTDERDFGENIKSGQQVGKCMEMADFKIINDSSLDDLYKKLDDIYEQMDLNQLNKGKLSVKNNL